jgi:hypothetical protein
MPHSSSGAPLDPVAFIHSQIRTVPDWPQPGVMFRDITTLLQSQRRCASSSTCSSSAMSMRSLTTSPASTRAASSSRRSSLMS